MWGKLFLLFNVQQTGMAAFCLFFTRLITVCKSCNSLDCVALNLVVLKFLDHVLEEPFLFGNLITSFFRNPIVCKVDKIQHQQHATKTNLPIFLKFFLKNTLQWFPIKFNVGRIVNWLTGGNFSFILVLTCFGSGILSVKIKYSSNHKLLRWSRPHIICFGINDSSEKFRSLRKKAGK